VWVSLAGPDERRFERELERSYRREA
jgi:hypothetical protein